MCTVNDENQSPTNEAHSLHPPARYVIASNSPSSGQQSSSSSPWFNPLSDKSAPSGLPAPQRGTQYVSIATPATRRSGGDRSSSEPAAAGDAIASVLTSTYAAKGGIWAPGSCIPRSTIQLKRMRGDQLLVSLMLLAAGVLFVAAYFAFGPKTTLLLFLSIVPLMVILPWLRQGKGHVLSWSLMLEMFWFGGTLSVLMALLFETIGYMRTRRVWKCGEHGPFSLLCDAKFTLVIIVCVGFVEEAAKLLPLARLKVSERSLPHSWTSWFRLAESPYAFALAGCASGAGFACIENIKYTFAPGDFDSGVTTAFWRAILSIPFHVACTAYAASSLAALKFHDENPELRRPIQILNTDLSYHRCPTGGGTLPQKESAGHDGKLRNPTSDGLADLEESPSIVANVGEAATAEELNAFWAPGGYLLFGSDIPNQYHEPTLKDYGKVLLVPAVLHGLYDCGLMLASQCLRLVVGDDDKGEAATSTASAAPDKTVDFAVLMASPYGIAILALLMLALTCYITGLLLARRAWKGLRHLEAVPMPGRTSPLMFPPTSWHRPQLQQPQQDQQRMYFTGHPPTLVNPAELQNTGQLSYLVRLRDEG